MNTLLKKLKHLGISIITEKALSGLNTKISEHLAFGVTYAQHENNFFLKPNIRCAQNKG